MIRYLTAIAVCLVLTSPPALILAQDNFKQDRDRAADAALAGNQSEYLRIMRGLAKRGDSQSQIALGNVLIIKGEFIEAEHWLKIAADTGNAQAQYAFGGYYLSRKPPDGAEANKWLVRAAEQGHAGAKAMLDAMTHPPQAVDGKYRISDLFDIISAMVRFRIDNLSDPALVCYKQTRDSMAPAIARATDKCKTKLREFYGEWLPKENQNQVGAAAGRCMTEQVLNEKNVSLPQLVECFKSKGL